MHFRPWLLWYHASELAVRLLPLPPDAAIAGPGDDEDEEDDDETGGSDGSIDPEEDEGHGDDEDDDDDDEETLWAGPGATSEEGVAAQHDVL